MNFADGFNYITPDSFPIPAIIHEHYSRTASTNSVHEELD
jgi:hypothetical protein